MTDTKEIEEDCEVIMSTVINGKYARLYKLSTLTPLSDEQMEVERRRHRNLIPFSQEKFKRVDYDDLQFNFEYQEYPSDPDDLDKITLSDDEFIGRLDTDYSDENDSNSYDSDYE